MQNTYLSSLFQSLIEKDDGIYIGQNANLTSLLTIKRPLWLLAIINGNNSTSRGRRIGVSLSHYWKKFNLSFEFLQLSAETFVLFTELLLLVILQFFWRRRIWYKMAISNTLPTYSLRIRKHCLRDTHVCQNLVLTYAISLPMWWLSITSCFEWRTPTSGLCNLIVRFTLSFS